MLKKINKELLIVLLIISNVFMIGIYLAKKETKYIVLEESSLGFIPRNIINKYLRVKTRA